MINEIKLETGSFVSIGLGLKKFLGLVIVLVYI